MTRIIRSPDRFWPDDVSDYADAEPALRMGEVAELPRRGRADIFRLYLGGVLFFGGLLGVCAFMWWTL